MRVSSVIYLIKEGFKNIWCNRIMSIASAGVMIACMILTGSAMIFSVNVNKLLEGVESKNSIRFYLNMDVSTLQAIQIGQEIKKVPNVNECKFIPKEKTVEEFSEILGSGPLSEGLSGEGNPFPHAYDVSLSDLSLYKQTIEQIKSIEGIESFTDIGETANKLTKLNKIVSTVGFILTIVLSIVSIFILSNTIRITMYSRRLEISIMKSVGATDWFIRVPFLVESIVIGMIAALVSSLVLKFVCSKVIESLKNVVLFNKVKFSNVSFSMVLLLITAGTIFGIFGAMITIRKYLKLNGGSIVEN